MEMSNNLAKALAAAQSEMKNAPLNRTNPHFKSKYADLAAIRDATVPVLAKHGLSIVQYTKMCDGTLMLHTRLLHESGEFLEGEYPLPAAYDKPQVMGSAYTYAKRYSWSAMLGVSAEDDDDGNAGQGAKPDITPKSATAPKDVATKSPEWTEGPAKNVTELKAMMRGFGRDLEACSDLAMFIALENASKPLWDQCKANLPSWWHGDGEDSKGAAHAIEKMRDYLTGKEADHQSFAA
jgi:hypothetical protein